jgi:hypothetical protein
MLVLVTYVVCPRQTIDRKKIVVLTLSKRWSDFVTIKPKTYASFSYTILQPDGTWKYNVQVGSRRKRKRVRETVKLDVTCRE